MRTSGRAVTAMVVAIAAFLGSQGDEWDAQKDILCDTLGALCASVVFLMATGRIGKGST
ncbi:MAG: DUF2238 domain-containing protein [Kiritimatiellae bacterium]|nr:DUF2238 domain-containing protein [Kiritimatiellia bacterium]MBR6587206.1 DUF2238 domain-containing protein [Kiritimatiellia bacterium]